MDVEIVDAKGYYFFLHSGFFSPGGQASISERFTDKQGLLLLPALIAVSPKRRGALPFQRAIT